MGGGSSRDVNPVGRLTLSDYLGPGCFSEPLWVGIWGTFLFILWILVSIVLIIYAVLMFVWSNAINLQAILLYLAVPLALSWLWWFFYPQLEPTVKNVIFPGINITIKVIGTAWNILCVLWNIFVRIWNGLVQLIGLFLYIIYVRSRRRRRRRAL
jgi:hypothetical protein